MKNKIIKTIALALVGIALISTLSFVAYTNINKANVYDKVLNGVNYCYDTEISVYQFPSRENAKKVTEKLKNTIDLIDIMQAEPMNNKLCICDGEADIEYSATGAAMGKIKYMAEITNDTSGLMYDYNYYQLNEKTVEKGIVTLKAGKMINFGKNVADGVEIVVTEETGFKVGDELYWVINGIDEKYMQTVTKATVVGIVECNSFLYGAPQYCGAISRDIESMYDNIFKDKMVFSADLSPLYVYEYSPNSLLDEPVKVNVLFEKKDGFNETEAEKLLKKYGGEVCTANTNKVKFDISKKTDTIFDASEEEVNSYISNFKTISIICVIGAVVVLIADVALIIKIFKKKNYAAD